MPDFEHNDLALFEWKLREAAHRRALGGRLSGRTLEPAHGFQFARHAPPQTAAIIQGAIPKTAQAIILRFLRRRFSLEQCLKRFLKNIFGLAVAKAERAPVKNQLRRLAFIQAFAPIKVIFPNHSSSDRHREREICIKIF